MRTLIGLSAAAALAIPLAGVSLGSSAPVVQDVSAGAPIGPPCVAGPATAPPLQNEWEQRVAVNPRNPQHVVMTWTQGFPGEAVVVAVSEDAGATFHQRVVPKLTYCTGGIGTYVADPWPAFGPDGRLYLATTPDASRTSPTPVTAVSTSADGGYTWSKPLRLGAGDRGSVIADPHRNGVAYLFSSSGEYAGNDILMWRTTDGGEHWSNALNLAHADNNTSYNTPVPTVLDNGTMVLAINGEPWNDGTLSRTYVLRSDDGGNSWSAPTLLGAVDSWLNPDTEVPQVSAMGTDIGMSIAGRPTPTLASYGDTVLVAWHDLNPGDVSNIQLSRSTDGGVTWAAPVSAVSERSQVFLPELASASDGSFALAYYDLRNDRPGDVPLSTDTWVSVSADGGQSWTERHLAGPFNTRAAYEPIAQTYVLTDYGGVASVPGAFLVSFVQAGLVAKDGQTDIFLARVPTP